MSVKRKKAREVALWMLYGLDVSGIDAQTACDDWYETFREFDAEVAEVWESAVERVRSVSDRLDELNELIQDLSPRWRVNRMAVIDRNILRLGVWELLEGTTPPIVTINACVELGKTYGEKNTPAFVNGLLDELCKRRGIDVSPQE